MLPCVLLVSGALLATLGVWVEVQDRTWKPLISTDDMTDVSVIINGQRIPGLVLTAVGFFVCAAAGAHACLLWRDHKRNTTVAEQ